MHPLNNFEKGDRYVQFNDRTRREHTHSKQTL